MVYMGKRIGAYMVWWGNLTESDHLEDFGVDIRITYIRGSLRYMMGEWTGLIWLRTGAGSCSYNNDHSVSTKCGELVD